MVSLWLSLQEELVQSNRNGFLDLDGIEDLMPVLQTFQGFLRWISFSLAP